MKFGMFSCPRTLNLQTVMVVKCNFFFKSNMSDDCYNHYYKKIFKLLKTPIFQQHFKLLQ